MSSFSLRGSQLSPLSSQFKPTRLSSTSNLQFQLRSIRSTTSNSSIHLRQLPSTSFSPVSTPILIPRNLSRVSPFNFSRFESTASTGLSRSKATSSNPTAISSESSTENQNKQVEGEQAETSISSSTAESTSIGSSTSPPHSHSPNSSVSGEELRKDLLQTELPPSSPSKGAEHDGAKELEAEVAGQIR